MLCREVMGVGHRRPVPRSRPIAVIGRRIAAAHRAGPCRHRTPPTGPRHAEVPQLQRFSQGMSDQGGVSESTSPRGHRALPAAAPRRRTPTRRPNASSRPARNIPAGSATPQMGAAAWSARCRSWSSRGHFAALDGDHSATPRSAPQQQQARRVVTGGTAPATARAISPITGSPVGGDVTFQQPQRQRHEPMTAGLGEAGCWRRPTMASTVPQRMVSPAVRCRGSSRHTVRPRRSGRARTRSQVVVAIGTT